MANELTRTDDALPAGSTSPMGRAALQRLAALDPGRILALGAVAIGFALLVTYVALRLSAPAYTLLFADLAPADARTITERLHAARVPYRLEGAGSILVPADAALRLRMDLAADGLPAGGSIGYELLDRTNPLTATEFQSNVNLGRALEGELARTIAVLRGVRAARVHLVQPKRRLFGRDAELPSASVVLSLASAGLEPRQIAAIRHLVAAAVPGLTPARVAIVDDRGTLLARGDADGAGGLVAETLEERRIQIEERLRAKIEALLERSVGPGRVHAEVTVELDPDEAAVQVETFDPDGQVARSVQSTEEREEREERGDRDAVTVTNNLPTEAGADEGGAATSERSQRATETTNYEISRELRQEQRRPGRIRRLSVAVQVDGSWAPGADGTLIFTPRDEDELARLAALVRSAAGVDEERGDVVEVVGARFVLPEAPAAEAPPLVTREELWRAGEILGLLLAILLALQLGVRPLLRRLAAAPAPPPAAEPLLTSVAGPAVTTTALPPASAEPGQGEALLAAPGGVASAAPAAERMVSLKQFAGEIRASLISEVAEFVASHPEDSARVVRSWLHGG